MAETHTADESQALWPFLGSWTTGHRWPCATRFAEPVRWSPGRAAGLGGELGTSAPRAVRSVAPAMHGPLQTAPAHQLDLMRPLRFLEVPVRTGGRYMLFLPAPRPASGSACGHRGWLQAAAGPCLEARILGPLDLRMSPSNGEAGTLEVRGPNTPSTTPAKRGAGRGTSTQRLRPRRTLRPLSGPQRDRPSTRLPRHSSVSLPLSLLDAPCRPS